MFYIVLFKQKPVRDSMSLFKRPAQRMHWS